MLRNKILDCVTFFDNNFSFELRYNILLKHVDYFLVCESKYDHKGKIKQKNFIWKNYYDKKKIKYVFIEEPFPKNTNRWENQAIQRENLLKLTDFAQLLKFVGFTRFVVP